mmetsp:Transcript_48335/g.97263  ORF Transcript_48335/g.97263 Transcript_48335/m.97263 type:complete len:135 (-) Transcript_48335:306-710(-)
MKQASKRASRRANEKTKDKTEKNQRNTSFLDTTILGWPFIELPPIFLSFYVASEIGGLIKVPIFFYWSMYRQMWTPTLSMLAGECFVYLLDFSARGERLFGIEPFNAMVATFALLSFAVRWVSPIIRNSVQETR